MDSKPHFVLIGISDNLLIERGRALLQDGFEVSAISVSGSKVLALPQLKLIKIIPREDEVGFVDYLSEN